MHLTTVTLSVPTSRVAEIYSFAATLYTDEAPSSGSTAERPKGLDDDAVRRAYQGGASEYWRPFLRVMAHHADEWVSLGTLCDTIGLSRGSAPGMLGAAERRCGGHPPYEKSGYTESGYWFRMPGHAANIVRELNAKP